MRKHFFPSCFLPLVLHLRTLKRALLLDIWVDYHTVSHSGQPCASGKPNKKGMKMIEDQQQPRSAVIDLVKILTYIYAADVIINISTTSQPRYKFGTLISVL